MIVLGFGGARAGFFVVVIVSAGVSGGQFPSRSGWGFKRRSQRLCGSRCLTASDARNIGAAAST